MTGKAYHGRCASKRSWFYGLKVQVVATSGGTPVEFYLHAGAEPDSTGRRGLALDLPVGSVLYPGAGYPAYVAEVTAAGFALKIALFTFAHALHQVGL